MHNDIQRAVGVACFLALLVLTAPMLSAATESAPAAAAPATASFAAAYGRAKALFDEGVGYARARVILQDLLKPGAPKVSDADARKAKALLNQIEMALADRYEAEETARKEFDAQAAKRGAAEAAQKKVQDEMLAKATQLVKEGEAEKKARKYQEATRLRVRVATERAIAAYDRAMDLVEQGNYDKAEVVLNRLNEWAKLQKTMDVREDLRPSIGASREEAIQRSLGQIADGRLNRAAGSTIIAERTEAAKKEAERQAKYRKALKDFDDAMMAYNRGQYDQANTLLVSARDSGVDLGADKNKQIADCLKKIADRKAEIESRRKQAVAQINQAQMLLPGNEWKAARELLFKAQREDDLLTGDQRKQLADLLKQAAEKEDAAMQSQAVDSAEIAAAMQYAKEAERVRKILEEQEDSTARMYLDIAKTEFGVMNLAAALQSVDKSLAHAKLPEAVELRAKIRALQGHPEEMTALYAPSISEEVQRRLNTVKYETDLAIQRGRNALDDNRYDDAIKQFTSASEGINYLRPYYDVAGVEAQVQGMLARARQGKEEADAKLNQRKIFDAMKQAEEEDRLTRQKREEQKIALFNEANAQYAQHKYKAALDICDRLYDMDPEFLPAQDLADNAREQIRHETWRALSAADQRAKDEERIKWREKLVFPSAVYQYPAKEIWDQIVGRGGVELPSGKAVKTPKELRLEGLLKQEMTGISLPGVPLVEAVEVLKGQLPAGVNFLVDPNLLQGTDVLINLEMKDVSLNTILRAMLRPKGLDFVIANGAFYISTVQGCLTEEARPENVDLREYDVQDLLVVLNTSGGSSGSSSGSSTSSSSGNNSSSSDSSSGSGLTGGSTDLLDMIQLFTGPENWDLVRQSSSSSDSGNNSGGGGGGLFGGGEAGGGAAGGAGGAAGTTGGLTMSGPGRIMFLRNGYLMVNHVDRIHKKIEEILAMLRAQTTILVQIEARLITYNDRFYKDVGMSWKSLPHATTGVIGPNSGIPGATWTFSDWSPPSFTADPVGASIFSISGTFLNRDHTQLIISMAEASSNAMTVSAPHVTVINGANQSLELTTKGSYVSSYSVQGNIAIPVITTYDANSITLDVTPVVSADRRYVTMEVEPSISQSVLGDPTTVQIPLGASGDGTGTQATASIFTPLTTEQTIKSTVRVPDRGTVVLGGLSTASESEGETGIPILSHIPVIKRMFHRSTVGHDRAHLLFMVTPTILLPEEVEP